MGHAKYIGRVGALAVALGVGAAVATGLGMGVAWADDTGSTSTDSPSTDSPSTGSPATGSTTAKSPSAGATGAASSPGPRQVRRLRHGPAGPNRTSPSSAGSAVSGTEASGSPTSNPSTGSADTSAAADNATTTPGDSAAQPGAAAGEPPPDTIAAPAQDAPAQESVLTNPQPPATTQAPAPQHTPTAVGADGSADGSTVVTHAADTHTAPAPVDAQPPTPRSGAQVAQVLRQGAADIIGTASQTGDVEAAETAQIDISEYSAISAGAPTSRQAVEAAETAQTDISDYSAISAGAPTSRQAVESAPMSAPAQVVTGVLAVLGLTPLATDTPLDPSAPPPTAWMALAVLRRELRQGLIKEAPITNYAPTDTTEVQGTDRIVDLGAATLTAQTASTTNAANTMTAAKAGLLAKPPKPPKPPKGNQPPTAVNDSAATTEDTPASGNVLANDTDANADTLTVASFSQPAHAAAFTLNPDGTFSYTPAANYNGPDAFTYTATDGTATSNTATAAITVTAVNDTPVATDDAFTGAEDSVLTGNVLTNDTDVDNSTLSAALVAGPAHAAAFTLNPDGTFSYTPAANYNGPDAFTYTATDGTATSNTATAAITVTAVNDTPVATDDAFTGAEDSVLTGNVLTNDTDVDNSTLSAALVAGPAHAAAFTLNPDGTFSYTPAANYNGPDAFTYTATDGTATSNTATAAITVTAVNDTPVATDDAFTGAEDSVLTGNVLTNDTDVDNSTLSAALVAGPAHAAAFTLNPDGTFSYTPAANYNGPDAFTYTATDGTATSNTATAAITVTADNDPPTHSATNTSTNPGTGVVTGTVVFTDPDGDTLTYTGTGATPDGSVVVNPGGTFTYTPTQAARLRADATLGADTDSFTVTVNDGHGATPTHTVSVTVSPGELTLGTPIPVGSGPDGVVFSPDGTLAYVANARQHRVGDQHHHQHRHRHHPRRQLARSGWRSPPTAPAPTSPTPSPTPCR